MESLSVARFVDLPTSPWANGLGETVELWRSPEDADFVMRLSIATIAEDSEFSALPGIDRSLMCLTPAGLCVVVNGVEHRLGQYDTVEFRGEDQTQSRDVRVAGRDLNLMVRRGYGRPRLRACAVTASGVTLPARCAVIGLDGHVVHGNETVGFGDCIVADIALAPSGIELSGDGLVAVATWGAPER